MCGDVSGNGEDIQLMFYALSLGETSDDTNRKVWFLGILTIFREIDDGNNLPTLNAEFKCKDSALVPQYVSNFHFNLLFGDG